jgi:hypothetical protein
MKMSELVTTIAKIEIAPKQKYLVLEVRHVARLLHASHTHLLHASHTHLLHASSYTRCSKAIQRLDVFEGTCFRDAPWYI